MKAIIRMNMMAKKSITTKAIDLAEKTFGQI